MRFEIWAFGSNGSGQLGLGHEQDVSVPNCCILLDGQTSVSSQPCAFAAGGNHSLIICEDGTTYAAGANDDGRCGSTQFSSSSVLEKVHLHDGTENIVNDFAFCAATWEASTFVTANGKVYTCGTGNKGELGQGANVVISNPPQRIQGFPPTGVSIVQLASSVGHTVVVLSNGEVYGWGNGRKGQLGEPSAIVWTPRKIEVPFRTEKAACGREFTYLVGSAEDSQHMMLGSNKWGIKSSVPCLTQPWKSIGTNWSSVHVLLADGEVLSWGRDNHGQLCPKGAPKFSEMVVGSEHAIARTVDGHTVAWGWAEHGNCGRAVEVKGDVEYRPNHIDANPAFHVFGAGCATSWLMKATEQ